MTEQVAVPKKQGAVIGGWICIILGAAFMVWTLSSFILYLPLFLAAFVLGIVAIAQRKLLNGVPILLLAIVVPLFLGFGLGSYRASYDAYRASTTASQPAQMSRAQFNAAVLNKTPEQVIAAVGRPDRTYTYDEHSYYWSYEGRTYDPITDKVDFSAAVWFEDGRVKRVQY